LVFVLLVVVRNEEIYMAHGPFQEIQLNKQRMDMVEGTEIIGEW
jgi:hypothetical protein